VKKFIANVLALKDVLGVPLVAQWVKDLALSLLWLRSQLWCGFDPSPWNLCRLWLWPKKKKKKKDPRWKYGNAKINEEYIERLNKSVYKYSPYKTIIVMS